MLPDSLFHKACNIMLRVASLASKLVLTLYMGRYLGLAEMGVYGIVFSATMITSCALGGRMDFVVARSLVGGSPTDVLRKMRDQAVFYAINYGIFTFLMLGLWAADVASPKILLAIYVISMIESIATTTSTNLVTLGHPMLSTMLFFVRAGLWGLFAAALGALFPAFRNVPSLLAAWAIGGSVSILWTLYFWRTLPWRDVARMSVDWHWIWDGARRSFPIWLGSIGGVGALQVERFVVSYDLDMEKVGIVTFYGSFASALLSMVESGFFAFSYPRLIRFHQEGETQKFWREVRNTTWEVCLFVLFAAVVVGIALPLAAPFFGKPEIAAYAWTFWMMLAAIWIRSNADVLHFILYARHQDTAIWLSGILFLIPALAGNLLLVPLCGLNGVGISAILASLFLFAWRFYHVKNPAALSKRRAA